MTATAIENKTIELWDGFTVDVNMQLLDDLDFTVDLQKAIADNDVAELIAMYMALVGGDDTYDKIREHIEKEHGYVSQKALMEIMDKISAVFPKSGNRAQRRSWKDKA